MEINEKRRQAGRKPVILQKSATWEDDSNRKIKRALEGRHKSPLPAKTYQN